ncbi:hypothetical protein ACFL43_00305 [Thermodesulfobacteriota bacterium]
MTKTTNKKQDKDIKKIIWTLIILAVAFTLLFIVMPLGVVWEQSLKFNHETDVCEEWEGILTQDCREIKFDDFIGKWVCFEEFKQMPCCPNTERSRSHPCTSWRSKTLCELDPEAEGCVCDEWENIIKNEKRTIYAFNCISDDNKTISFNLDVTPGWIEPEPKLKDSWECHWNKSKEITLQEITGRKCIKAHEALEDICEPEETYNICMVEHSEIFFENHTGWFFRDNALGYEVDPGRRITTLPGTKHIFCKNISDMKVECIEPLFEIETGCSWCYSLTSEGELVDTGESCLSENTKEILHYIGKI